MKCGRIGCIGQGVHQPLIRIRAAVAPANGSDVLAMIRLPFTVCTACRLKTTRAEILEAVPKGKMEAVVNEAKKRTGASYNPDRTEVHWIRIVGK